MSEKKARAAAAHLREQATVLAGRVPLAEAKLERARDHVAAAEEGLAETIAAAEAAEQAAADAEAAIDGLDVSVAAQPAAVGVER